MTDINSTENMGALGRRHPHVHVRDDLLQLPDSDTLGQGLDILIRYFKHQ